MKTLSNLKRLSFLFVIILFILLDTTGLSEIPVNESAYIISFAVNTENDKRKYGDKINTPADD
jgi:hypothetical protein